jgi:hypothetical protein
MTGAHQYRPPFDDWHRQVLALEKGLVPGHAGLKPGRASGRRGRPTSGPTRGGATLSVAARFLLAGGAVIAGIAQFVQAL